VRRRRELVRRPIRVILFSAPYTIPAIMRAMG
jgi:hypothetical protein